MTWQQLKAEIRNAYENRDREGLERALALLDALLRDARPKQPQPEPALKWEPPI